MGLWIFASVTLFSVVFLYTKTKDQWNWKKISLWFAGIIGTLVAAMVLLVYWDNLFPKEITGTSYKGHLSRFQDIKIGSKFSDVQFKYGVIQKEKSLPGDNFDLYLVTNEIGLYVDKAGKVDAIVVKCDGGNDDKFNGIVCGDPGEKLEKKFGADLKILCNIEDKNGWETLDARRAYDVAKYGTRYVLQKNKVILVGILQDEDFQNSKKKWKSCD